MAKKHKAQRIIVFAVYRKFWLNGHAFRYLKVAYPSHKDAEAWVKNEVATSNGAFKEPDFIVEEMPATMKAWQP